MGIRRKQTAQVISRRKFIKLRKIPISRQEFTHLLLACSQGRSGLLGKSNCPLQFKFNVALRPHAETMRTIMDGEPRTSTSTFTQLPSSCVQCSFMSTETIGAQDVHLDFHPVRELCSHGNITIAQAYIYTGSGTRLCDQWSFLLLPYSAQLQTRPRL